MHTMDLQLVTFLMSSWWKMIRHQWSEINKLPVIPEYLELFKIFFFLHLASFVTLLGCQMTLPSRRSALLFFLSYSSPTLPRPRSPPAPAAMPLSLLSLLLSLVLSAPSQAIVPGKYFDYMFIIVFENEGFAATIADPNFLAYSKKGVLLTNFFASYHPSQPNYLNMGAGD